MIYPEILPKSRFSSDKEHIETKEFNHITITCNTFNIDENLGCYYLDMREAFLQYDAGIFGDFDENGVPMVGWGASARYSAVNIAQYGFILHDSWLENTSEEYLSVMKACLKQLMALESEENDCIFWREPCASDRYNLKSNWTSAMSLGECMSFYLRMYQITNESKILQKCDKIYNSTQVSVQENGVKVIDKNGDWWLEEYPSTASSHVLNGFIYAVFGLVDYQRVKKSEKVQLDLNKYYKTLVKNISLYNVGYWSIYDLHYKELVKYYYQKNVHIPQLDALYRLTKHEEFHQMAKKWRKTIHPINFSFVKIMYRVRPRIQKLIRLFR
jgi:heparosan-N-sulfate-glucuronate 5-epimerase